MLTKRIQQTVVGSGVLLVGLAMAAGAWEIPSAAGYGGVGPNFLPWLVALGLVVCGVVLVAQALGEGFQASPIDADLLVRMPESGEASPTVLPVQSAPTPVCWSGFVWVSAGLLANATLITTLGFILSCSLCFVLAARGLRLAEQPVGRLNKAMPTVRTQTTRLIKDAALGMAIAAPVYWMFTKLLSINLPGLTATGWL